MRALAGTVVGLDLTEDDDATQGERLSDIAWALATVEQTHDSLRMALWAVEGILVRSSMFPANEAWRELAMNVVLYLLEDLGNLASQNGAHNITPDDVWARLGPLSREAWLDNEERWSSVKSTEEQFRP